MLSQSARFQARLVALQPLLKVTAVRALPWETCVPLQFYEPVCVVSSQMGFNLEARGQLEINPIGCPATLTFAIAGPIKGCFIDYK